MSIANKLFKNNKTGETIKVIDSFENIAILENKQKIDVRTLMDSNQYTEQIDPNQFFNNQGSYNSLFEKIKTIPINHIKDEYEDGNIKVDPSTTYDNFGPVSNESAIIMTTEEDEKAELARKYGVNPNPIEATSRQNEAFAKLLGEGAENELPPIARPVVNEPIQRVEINRDIQQSSTVQQITSVEDPILTMFKRTKRNVEFKINVEISDKIPRLDFIEMMEDSYEVSMIDFLADEFTNKILQDPSVIRDSIKDKIKQLVYGGEIKIPVNPQITDSVTQFEKHEQLSIEKEPVLSKNLPKKTTTRKSITKKESTEK
jgi:hypothetical protein